MQLVRARIANFRSLRNVEVEFGGHTAFIGGNGAGKSSIIRALDRFFATPRVLDADDFFGRDQSQVVEIELSFGELSDEENDVFGSRVRDGLLVITRVFNTGADSGSYYGSTLINKDFDQVRQAVGAMPKRNAYSALKETQKYDELPAANSAAAVDAALVQWENDHPAALQLGRDDGRFFGFQNASRTAIGQYVSFVFIPAVREAMTDAADSKNSPIGRLMELLVRSAILKKEAVASFREKINAEYKQLISPENMPELSALAKVLTDEIKGLYQEADVGLSWRPAVDMEIPLPSADVTLTDVGFGGPVDRQGHGLQRAFIFSLLQQLAKASVTTANPGGPAEGAPVQVGPDEPAAVLGHARTPNLIIAIEEPELYQHPTKQRHFASVLRRLSDKALPGAEGRTQVVLASHSPLFVSLPNVDEIRFVRRTDCEGEVFKQCELTALDLGKVAGALGVMHRKPIGTYTAATLLPRLHILGSELAEGFFADGIVLVEGRSDKAALYAAAALAGVDFEAHGIAVLPVESKNNLDRPYLIFKELGIPTFIIWDCDDTNSDANLALLRAVEPDADHQTDAFSTLIATGFARFGSRLEAVLKQELGTESFLIARAAACQVFEMHASADAEKNPVVMRTILAEAAKAHAFSPTLELVIKAVWRDLKGEAIGAPGAAAAPATQNAPMPASTAQPWA